MNDTPWIEYDGKGLPVSRDTIVCIRLRCGTETPEHWMTQASEWSWGWADARSTEPYKSGDIIAYRIISPTHEPAIPSQALGS